MLGFFSNAWNEVKIPRKISVEPPKPSTAAHQRTFSMNTRRSETNRDLARTHIRPIEWNR